MPLRDRPEITRVRIATGWLEPGGYLGAVDGLSQFGQTLLTNIAPVTPEAASGGPSSAAAKPAKS